MGRKQSNGILNFPNTPIYNQAKRITVKPRTKLIEIGGNLHEIGYHYNRNVGKMKKGKGNKKVSWF